MASIVRDPKGKKRILYMAGDGRRKAIRLGKTSLKQAEAFKEGLLAARITGSMNAVTAHWIANLPNDVHRKLANVGLVTARAAKVNTTLKAFLDDYLERRTDLKPNSHLVYGQSRRTLIEFFGPDKPISEITEQDAGAWRTYLSEQGLSEATQNKRCGNAEVFFNIAKNGN